MAQTHWKKLINPDYIGAYALDPGKDLTVQISLVRREMVTGADGRVYGCVPEGSEADDLKRDQLQDH